MAKIRDGLYDKRRTINGLRVLVAAPPNATGLIPENYSVRVKHPAGDIDLEMNACYYWQVFDAVRKMWPTMVQRINQV
jgi:hypothetical protein